MNKQKPEDVMRALECCITKHHENCCQLGTWSEEWNCMTDLMKKALALLREKDAEIERLTINMNAYGLTAKNIAKDFADYQADVQMEIADARAEAITETVNEFVYQADGRFPILAGITLKLIGEDVLRTLGVNELKGETDGETDL